MITTCFHFQNQTHYYRGKVRDVYFIGEDLLIMVTTDRISAFDVVLPQEIPYKGQILNQIAAKFLDATGGILPNWKLAVPDPMVTIGLRCKPFPIEMVIRGYLTGGIWRAYKGGARTFCSVYLPNGMKKNEQFKSPIITPTTKVKGGHDENISKEEIIRKGLVSLKDYEQLEYYTKVLFQIGSDIAASKGLILVDTKYEFGKKEDEIYLIDEVHTPDSSRFFYAKNYYDLFKKGEEPHQLSKEFVRQWLIGQGFQGKKWQIIPLMTPEYIQRISEKYIELYELLIGEKFIKGSDQDISTRIKKNVNSYIAKYGK